MAAPVIDECDRKQPQVMDLDKSTLSRTVPDSTLHANQVNFSTTPEQIEQFKTEPTPWAAPKPDDFHSTVHATADMLQATSGFTNLLRAWLSLLVEPGTVLAKVGSKGQDVSLVLSFAAWRSSLAVAGEKAGWHQVLDFEDEGVREAMAAGGHRGS